MFGKRVSAQTSQAKHLGEREKVREECEKQKIEREKQREEKRGESECVETHSAVFVEELGLTNEVGNGNNRKKGTNKVRN